MPGTMLVTSKIMAMSLLEPNQTLNQLWPFCVDAIWGRMGPSSRPKRSRRTQQMREMIFSAILYEKHGTRIKYDIISLFNHPLHSASFMFPSKIECTCKIPRKPAWRSKVCKTNHVNVLQEKEWTSETKPGTYSFSILESEGCKTGRFSSGTQA